MRLLKVNSKGESMFKLLSLTRNLTLLIGLLVIVGCSTDVSHLPIEEQSLKHDGRYSDDEDKDSYRKPLDVLKFSGIQKDMTVVDLLGGGGYYSELFSYLVGKNGKVYLQNNSLFLRFSTEELEDRLEGNRLANVVRLDSDYADMNLPENIDVFYLGLSFHDFFVKRDDPVISANPSAFYSQVYKSLKPGGSLIIIDHSAAPGMSIDKSAKLHRIDEDWARQQLEQNGFKFEEKLDILRNPSDDFSLDIWNKKVYHKTDRFIHRYKKINKNSDSQGNLNSDD